MRLFLELTKFGIVIFVLFTGLAGYLLGQNLETPLNFSHLIFTLISLFGYSAGSFVINQIQEIELDRSMKRTGERPLPAGNISKPIAFAIASALLITGCVAGFLVNDLVGLLGIITVLLYNGFYTLIWKRKWVFGAVPGAIPGAMPVVIGYAAHTHELWRPELIYMFLIMFMWQMPHYWALALKFKEEYKGAGIPVLPVTIGDARTFYHMGLYTIAYVGLVFLAPFFVPARFAFIFVSVPFALKVLWEFVKYYRWPQKKHWVSFFLWTTLSVLVFLIAPVIDRWQIYWSSTP